MTTTKLWAVFKTFFQNTWQAFVFCKFSHSKTTRYTVTDCTYIVDAACFI